MSSMATEKRNMAQEQADAYAETLEEIWAAIDADEEIYDGQDPREYLDNLPLEIVWEKGEPFAVVLGTGGPHTEITGGGRASGAGFELRSYWGDEGVRRSSAINRTGAYFRELVDTEY